MNEIDDEVVAPRKRGRPRKTPYVHILSPEKVLEIKGITPEEDAAKRARLDADAKRKRDERARVRAEKAVADIQSYEELWQHNRKLLPEAELNALLEREQRVLDQIWWVDSVMAGTNLPPDDPDYVSVEEGAADLRAFVKANGFVTMQIVLLQYWKEPIWEKFQGNDAMSIFARLGIVVGMPGSKLHEWEQYLAQKAKETATASSPTPPPGNGYTTMKCTSCDSHANSKSVLDSIAARYAELGIPYECHRCRDLERRSRAQSTLYGGRG